MPHTCQTNHSPKECPKHKILVLHYNIFTAKLKYQVSISSHLGQLLTLFCLSIIINFPLKLYCEIKIIVPIALLKDKRPILI